MATASFNKGHTLPGLTQRGLSPVFPEISGDSTGGPPGHRPLTPVATAAPSRPARPASWPSAWWERPASRYPLATHVASRPPAPGRLARHSAFRLIPPNFGTFRRNSAEPV